MTEHMIEPDAALASGHPAHKAGETLIELRDLDKSYGAFKALQGMQFELRAGEVHVLFGENGAGKSTLIQIICGVQGFDSGSYRLFDEPVSVMTPALAHDKGVSIVFQEFSLIPEMTVEENLFLATSWCRACGLPKPKCAARCMRCWTVWALPLIRAPGCATCAAPTSRWWRSQRPCSGTAGC